MDKLAINNRSVDGSDIFIPLDPNFTHNREVISMSLSTKRWCDTKVH